MQIFQVLVGLRLIEKLGIKDVEDFVVDLFVVPNSS